MDNRLTIQQADNYKAAWTKFDDLRGKIMHYTGNWVKVAITGVYHPERVIENGFKPEHLAEIQKRLDAINLEMQILFAYLETENRKAETEKKQRQQTFLQDPNGNVRTIL